MKIPKGKRSQWLDDNKLSRSSVYRWVRRLKNLDQRTLAELRRLTFNKIDKLGIFPQEEVELKTMFDERRCNGNKVTYSWLKATMQFICKKNRPQGYDPEKNVFSNNWCRKFCIRFKISLQRKTNNKAKTILEKIHIVKNYHYFVLYKFPNLEPPFCRNVNANDSDEESDTDSYSDDVITDDDSD